LPDVKDLFILNSPIDQLIICGISNTIWKR